MDLGGLRAFLAGGVAQAAVEARLQVFVRVLVNASALLVLHVAHHHRLCNVTLLALATEVEGEGGRS